MKPSAANAGACALLVSMKFEKVCNGHGLVKRVKSEALGENTGLLYGNEKENRRLAFLSLRAWQLAAKTRITVLYQPQEVKQQTNCSVNFWLVSRTKYQALSPHRTLQKWCLLPPYRCFRQLWSSHSWRQGLAIWCIGSSSALWLYKCFCHLVGDLVYCPIYSGMASILMECTVSCGQKEGPALSIRSLDLYLCF